MHYQKQQINNYKEWLYESKTPNYDKYELERRNQQHQEAISKVKDRQNCLHNGCFECYGTGIKKDGSVCIHMISCPCDRCSHGRMVCHKSIANECGFQNNEY